MKKNDILSLIYQFASPVLILVLGVILFLSPDTASALIAKLLGWAMTLTGVLIGISAILDRKGAVGKGIAAVGCVCIGGFLTANPLLLAAGIGRLLGVLIVLRGIRDLYLHHREGRSNLLAVITTVVGAVLVLLPMTTSRVVFRLCGVVILAIGIAMLLDRLKDRRYLDKGDDDIIDAL